MANSEVRNQWLRTLMVGTKSMAMPVPTRTRAKMVQPMDGAKPKKMEAMPARPKKAAMVRRGPQESVSRPAEICIRA